MKRLAVLLLMGTMALGTVACGTMGQGTQQNSNVTITEANAILTNVWEEYNETASEDTKFDIFGGNMENMIMGTPEKFDATLEGALDALAVSYCIPTDAIAMTDDIATMMHARNANTFSGAAYHVTESANVQTVVDSIKNATLNNQWMCGFPETLIIVTVGDDYVVSAFGNAQLIDTFKTAITSVYGDMADVVVEQALAR